MTMERVVSMSRAERKPVLQAAKTGDVAKIDAALTKLDNAGKLNEIAALIAQYGPWRNVELSNEQAELLQQRIDFRRRLLDTSLVQQEPAPVTSAPLVQTESPAVVPPSPGPARGTRTPAPSTAVRTHVPEGGKASR